MATRPSDVAHGARQLAGHDPVLRALRARHGDPPFGAGADGRTPFEALARAVVHQQLAGKAAAAIFGRLQGALGTLDAAAVLAVGPEVLRQQGVSAAKAAALTDLALHADDGRLALGALADLGDEEVITSLLAVRGVGRWTAEMFLVFHLGRLDVWPVGDFGVRTGYAAAFGLEAAPSPKELGPFGEPFRPYRSIAAWYCWRAAEDARGAAAVAGVNR